MLTCSTIAVPGYQSTKQLYAGSRTLVYRAIRETDQQPVVIKLLKHEHPSFSELVQFRNQYAITKSLNISGVIQPYSLEPYRNGYALVMEDMGGTSLRHFAQGQALLLEPFFKIALQVIDILHLLHQQHIIHKDLKPANILIHPETHHVKLIDFSIASLLPREPQAVQNPCGLEGTLAYLSPEQTGRMNRGIDYRSDFYSLGITFFELLTGQLPFQADDPMEMVHCHLARQPPSICDLKSELPVVLSEIISKLMAKNVEDRYQSALGLKHDLESCLHQLQESGTITPFALGQWDVSDRFLIPETLYGREQEVQTLLEAFERVANGASELMLVAGFSGIGKTAVVNEVHKPIVRRRGYFVKGKYDQFQRNIPFGAFVQAFRDLMGQLRSESDAQLQQWQDSILSALGENAQVLIEVIPELEQIIGKQPPAPNLTGSAAQNRFNLLFQKFMAVFATREHPLVMFLDDLQWADSASLNLMQVLLAEQDRGYLFIIAAYRDNEVSPTHSLMLTLAALAKANATINTLTLAPLSAIDVNRLIADTLSCPEERALPLSELVSQKAKGNPFFTTQFLKALHEEKLISFDGEAGFWQCDVAQVRSLSLTDDVVEFMALQLQKLPIETQTALKLAACIGNQFDLATLAIILEQSETEAAIVLWSALREGLILPISETYKFFQNGASENHTNQILVPYKFLHDRVQQAAYSLIPEADKQSTHLAIGTLLLNSTPPDQIESNIFKIINHLNLGYTDHSQLADRQQLIQLNLIAGRKARAAIAYEPALDYLNIGISILDDQAWSVWYDLTLTLYLEAMEVSYFVGDFNQAEEIIEVVSSNSTNLIDRVKGYEIQILVLIAKQCFLEALEAGLQALRLLCKDIPEKLTSTSADNNIRYINDYVAHQQVAHLGHLPEMTNPEALASLRILDPLFTATYVAAPHFIPFISALGVKLSIDYGNSPLSILMYTNYGALLCNSPKGVEQGYEFGELALTLLSSNNNKEFSAKILCMIGGFILPWKLHLKQSLPLLTTGYQSGLESGTLNYTAFNSYHKCRSSFFLGQNLLELEKMFSIHSQKIRQMKQELPLNYIEMIRQVTLNLIYESNAPWILQGEAYDEQASLLQYHQSKNREALHYLHLYKLMACYWFENYSEGLNYVDKAEEYLDSVPGQLTIPLFYFYSALVRLASCIQPYTSQEQPIQAVESIALCGDQLQEYANHSPLNFQHKCDLVQAEKYRVLENKLEAIEYYDRAIAGANANDYIQEAAIANELAAKFYLAWGKERIAQEYMIEAYYGYARWGAKSKIVDLETRYPQLLAPVLQQSRSPLSINETVFAPTSTVASTSVPSSSISDTLDLAAMLKASQTLSSEIELGKLLSTLLHLIIENAGADTCVLLLLDNSLHGIRSSRLLVKGFARVGTEPVVLQQIPIEESQDIPLKLIYCVKNCLEPVVLMDATAHPEFVTDPYFLRQQPKSILCSPILHQGELLGIVYLENNLTIGAFTRDRVELLHLLCAQAAISLENSRLYERSRQYAQQLEVAFNDLQQAQLQIVQSEKMSALGNLVAGVAHEINNPVGFIAGNLNPALDYVQDTFGLLDLYQQEYPQPSRVIQDEIEAIDLDYIREDLPKLISSMQLGVQRIRDISTSLRTFSRADKDYKVPFNLHEGIDSTILILKHRLKADNTRPEIEVVTHYGNLPTILCFPGQLNQVFMNILANAIDALEEANQSLSFADITANPNRIEIHTQLDDATKQVVVQIRDNGTGMPDKIQQRVFDHLFTTKAVGKGTGLGLAIAHQIVVEQHGGTIKVHSQVGEGTLFIITLPIQNPSQP